MSAVADLETGTSTASTGHSHSRGRQLSKTKASQIEDLAWSLVPQLFQDLVGQGRPLLMEVSGEPHSLLAQAVCQVTGRADAAVCCGKWNGVDVSVTEGVRLGLERLKLEKPQVVWLRTSCGPFSQFQQINQRTEEQQQNLKEKRQHAQREYVGALCLAEAAIQQGAHVVWEWSDASQAWRLPAIQKFQQRHKLLSAVTKGCSVNFRDAKGRLVRKGWKILTTHQRLAHHMHQPCRCDSKYTHGTSEGEVAHRSRSYTQEYAYKAARLLAQEHSYQAVVQECSGQPDGLPQGFGAGEYCVCGDLAWPGNPRTCGSCLLGRNVVPRSEEIQEAEATKEPGGREVSVQGSSGLGGCEAGCYCDEARQQVEAQAKVFRKEERFSYHECEKILEAIPSSALKGRREMVRGRATEYQTFGAFSHGAQYGTTVVCQRYPETLKYINAFIRSKTQSHECWSTVTLNRNQQLPLHRDVHNHPQEASIIFGFGSYKQGELWVEDPDVAEDECSQQQLPDGRIVKGRKHSIYHRAVRFNGKAWHGPLGWEGSRVTLTAYTSRGVHHLRSEQKEELRKWGFRLPRMSRDEKLNSHQPQAYPATEVPNQAPPESRSEGEKKRDRIQKKLYLLHAATGHCSVKHMVGALRKRGAPEEVIRQAEQFKCSVCAERQKVSTRHVASLEPLPPKWATVSADVGHFQHPHSREHVQFLMILDEGSRFRMARILTRGAKQTPSAMACIRYFQEGWTQVFGHPRTLRLDPAVPFRSQMLEDYCDQHGIFLDIVPGEAHWKIGACESAIKGVKEVMMKLCECEQDISLEEALSTAVRTFNQRDLIRGFSPVQHALGRSPDESGRVIDAVQELPPELLVGKRVRRV